MNEQIQQLRTEAMSALGDAKSLRDVDDVRVQFLGKKGGITALRKTIGSLPEDERPVVGKLLTELHREITDAIESAHGAMQAAEQRNSLERESIDVTLPSRRRRIGRVHPISQTVEKIREIARGLGFEEVTGPEVETEYYNFDALNTPPDHPARDLRDTFYIGNTTLLRTETSSVQIRIMEQRRPPIRIFTVGRVYRRDADASHSPMFHQLEVLLVDKDVRFSDLKGTLAAFARGIFGPDTRVRFRPHYFPFTEPSAEVDVSCPFCGGDGCRVCKRTGWLEILGAGLVDPEVFKSVDYDPEVYTGFAFGMGVDRVTMLRHRIHDIRLLFEHDVRFLAQF